MDAIYCNKCGKQLKICNGIVHEDFVFVKKAWGYYSKKDGTTQEFVFCEECMERLERELVLPAKQYETTEML